MVQSVDCVIDVEERVVGLGSLRLDGESSSGCCGGIGNSSGGGSFLPLPGLEGEVEKDNGDDETEGEDVDKMLAIFDQKISISRLLALFDQEISVSIYCWFCLTRIYQYPYCCLHLTRN